MKKIAIFGNTNNYPLLLALGLRALGHYAVLVVNRKERLHRPESKFPEIAGRYPDWILDCSDIPEEEFLCATPRIGPVLDFLGSESSGLVLNDMGPSLHEFVPLPAVALMTGSDLTYFADPAMPGWRCDAWAPDYVASPAGQLWTRRLQECVARQRAGLRAARAISTPPRGLVPAMDTLLDDIGITEGQREFFYMADTSHSPARPNRGHGRLRVVNGARLNWRRPLPTGFHSLDLKGTDVLLEGFAAFVAAGGDGELVLFRKGLHVVETEQLTRRLGIADRIVWRDELSLREFQEEIAGADVVCDQLGEAMPGMVAVDAMAMGLPVIANFRPEIMGSRFPVPIAACQARAASEVAAHLTALADPRARVAAGRAARHFARTHLSPEANARRCLAHLGLPVEARRPQPVAG